MVEPIRGRADVTTNTTHTRWLGNVLDRVAMSHIATVGMPTYNKDMACDINSHFGEVLAGLKESAGMEDVDVGLLIPDSV